MSSELDRFMGCFMGLALGDALGAPFEGGPLERGVWRLIGTTSDRRMRFTDDTQMSWDLARSLIEHRRLDPDDVAMRFAKGYRWSRGYGKGAARLLRKIGRGEPWERANRSIYPDGSFGNGGAMRAPVIGLFFRARPDALVPQVERSARITHAHPEAIEGAVLIATAVQAALRDPSGVLESVSAHVRTPAHQTRYSIAQRWIQDGASPEPHEVARQLGNGIRAVESCVTGLYLGLRFVSQPFMSLHQFAVKCRGDVDTISAMAGAIWGAANGWAQLPQGKLEKLEKREQLEETARKLFEASSP